MRKAVTAGLIVAALGSALLARADGINIPAPSWTYAITALGTNVATFLAANLTVNGALKVSSGTPSQAACADLSNGGTACSQQYLTGACTAGTASGSWTAGSCLTIGTDATSGSPQYTDQVGSYEQIGRLVTFRFRVRLNGTWTGSPTGNVQINGIPVTSSSTTSDTGACTVSFYTVAGLAALTYGVSGTITPGTTSVILYGANSANTGQITAAQFGASGFVIGACSYHT